MELSLDDFIKQKNFKSGPLRQRGRQNRVDNRNGTSVLRRNKPPHNNNGRVMKPIQRRQSIMTDARTRIIQKSRMRVKDAREKLNDIAKLSDARTKIRGRNSKAANGRRDRDQAYRGQSNRRSNNNVLPSRPLLQRSIRNNMAREDLTRNHRDDVTVTSTNLIRCTISRPVVDYSEVPAEMDMDDDVDMPLSEHRDNFNDFKVVAQNDYTPYHQDYSPPRTHTYPDYDQPVYERHYAPPSVHRGPLTLARSSPRMSQEMRARLDSPAQPSGLFSWTQYPSSRSNTVSPPRSPAAPPGYRIVVSNLHPSVTHEDIKELFVDIGPLLDSRLVRPGIAEVIYKTQKDAKKAVEAYHNRQLDRQPMKCLLVNPRAPLTSSSSGVLKSSNLPAAPKFPNSSKSSVVPDLSAIHKALFMSK